MRGAAFVLVPLPLPKDAAGVHLPTLLQGNPPSRALCSSLLRFGEHPRGYPDVASGRCTGTLRQRGRERLPGKRGRARSVTCYAQRGKAVSSERDIRVPEAKRGRVPCRNEDEYRFPCRIQAEPRISCRTREHKRGAVSHLGRQRLFYVRAGSAEKLSLPRRTQPGSAHAHGRHQPGRG